jgi:hypothetical protein
MDQGRNDITERYQKMEWTEQQRVLCGEEIVVIRTWPKKTFEELECSVTFTKAQ